VVLALGELPEVQQLPPGHDQVADGQPAGGQPAGPGDNLQQQARHVLIGGHQDVGHERAHDGGR
jgi:hypothetical protein